MDFSDTTEEAAFRTEVRAWIADNANIPSWELFSPVMQ